jgi:hypothetical protein
MILGDIGSDRKNIFTLTLQEIESLTISFFLEKSFCLIEFSTFSKFQKNNWDFWRIWKKVKDLKYLYSWKDSINQKIQKELDQIKVSKNSEDHVLLCIIYSDFENFQRKVSEKLKKNLKKISKIALFL